MRPLAHPAISGREAEMAGLADAVRRLVELCTVVDGTPEVLASVTASLEEAADQLAGLVPDPPLPRFVRGSDDTAPVDLHGTMPYDVVVGRFNPLAPPVQIEPGPGERAGDGLVRGVGIIGVPGEDADETPVAVGHCRFTKAYEGAPGWVHGGALASAFDMVLTAANRLAGETGPTVRLGMRFRRPTLLSRPCRFEAWVVRRTDTRVFSVGRVLQDGRPTVEAEGEFTCLGPDEIGVPSEG